MADYPIGKAQKTILDMLVPGHKISSFAGANEKFEEFGIVVASRREGRTSVPVVTIKNRFGGGFTADGDGDVWRQYEDLSAEQKAALQGWMKK